MAKITINRNKSGNVISVVGKLSGMIKALKAMGFKETADEGEDIVHIKTFEPTSEIRAIDVLKMCIKKGISVKLYTVIEGREDMV